MAMNSREILSTGQAFEFLCIVNPLQQRATRYYQHTFPFDEVSRIVSYEIEKQYFAFITAGVEMNPEDRSQYHLIKYANRLKPK